MNRDIFTLTRRPELHKLWINTVVQYIRQNHGDPLEVDAVVGPETAGFVFALGVAYELKLPFIPIREAGRLQADSDDVLQATYKNKDGKVNGFFDILTLLVCCCLLTFHED